MGKSTINRLGHGFQFAKVKDPTRRGVIRCLEAKRPSRSTMPTWSTCPGPTIEWCITHITSQHHTLPNHRCHVEPPKKQQLSMMIDGIYTPNRPKPIFTKPGHDCPQVNGFLKVCKTFAARKRCASLLCICWSSSEVRECNTAMNFLLRR